MAEERRRAARGHTWDDWPCCGARVEESELYRGRDKKEVICDECRTLMKLGEDARKNAAASGTETYRWTAAHYCWPGYHGRYHFRHRRGARITEPSDAGDALKRKMFEFVNTLTRRTHENPWESRAPAVLTCDEQSRRVSRYEDVILVQMDPRERAALDALDQAIREALESAYHEGKRRGQSILLNLAGDELSISEFNRRTAEGQT